MNHPAYQRLALSPVAPFKSRLLMYGLFLAVSSSLIEPAAASSHRPFVSPFDFLRGGVIDVTLDGPDATDPPFVEELQQVIHPLTLLPAFLPVTPWGDSPEKSIVEGPTDFLPPFSVGRRFSRPNALQGSGQTIVTQFLTGFFDPFFRFNGFDFAETEDVDGSQESNKPGQFRLVDEDEDGNSEGFEIDYLGEVAGQASAQAAPASTLIRVNFVFVDIDNDQIADAVTIPWIPQVLASLGADLNDRIPEEYPVYLPLADPLDEGRRTIALDLDGDTIADPRIPLVVPLAGEIGHRLHFAQFGDGELASPSDVSPQGGLGISSEFVLVNTSKTMPANGTITLKGDDGLPLTEADLDGQNLPGGTLDFMIPACGIRILATDGLGPLSVGSASILADKPLLGIINFAGPFGAAGVGLSIPLPGFGAPIVTNSSTNTGIAVGNPGPAPIEITLKLIDRDGTLVATAQLDLDMMGHRSLFVSEIDWVAEPGQTLNFDDFEGLLKAETASGRMTATVVQTRGSQFITMPVGPLNLAGASLLPFAQFGNGVQNGNQVASEFYLMNLDDSMAAEARIFLRGDDGELLRDIDLIGGEQVTGGVFRVDIPACGLRILRTTGEGPLTAGAAEVASGKPIVGIINFSGTVGAAGVGSTHYSSGFSAPMVKNSTTNTGVAIRAEFTVTIGLRLIDVDGQLLATASLQFPFAGHTALFVDQIEWIPEPGVELDFSNFLGTLKAIATPNLGGRVAATVIQTRPGEFITMPVGPNPD